MSHHHTHRYLFLNFHKSAALLVCTQYNVRIQAINLHLMPVTLLYLAVLQTTNLGIKQYFFFLNWLINEINTVQNYLCNDTVLTPNHSQLIVFALQKL